MDTVKHNSTEEKELEKKARVNRRQFLKFSMAGTALGTMALTGISGEAEARVKRHDTFPVEVTTAYKPFPQKDTVFSRAVSGVHPTLGPGIRKFERFECDPNKPGFTRLDWALHHGAWSVEHSVTGGSKFGLPNTQFYSWKQKTKEERDNFLDLNYVYDEKYKFKSKQEAADSIKRAARLFGASIIGITHHNKNWDYSRHYNALANEEIGWEKFPFEPKTVIVLALEMDYEAIATAPSYTVEGAIGEGYSKMAYVAYQTSVFLKCLGYKAVACGNDLALSVPYAIQAGLGEGGRNGLLITQKYGPRVRICKVFTELDFVEYDKPVTFGVREFCERCKRCATACPGEAIPKDDKPTMSPPDDGERWFNNPGVSKWYLNAKKCIEYWFKGNNSCASCIASCPYNKPDFWHHRLIEKVDSHLPGPGHTFMRQMDIIFGYGNTEDPKAVSKFWNKKGRKYLGY